MRMALGVVALTLAVTAGCGRRTTLPATAKSTIPGPAGEADRLPFDREAQPSGISPTSSLIPPGANLPAGTPVTVRLLSALSSASAHSGDTFLAELDEPIIVAGQTLAERGAQVTCRVIEAKASADVGDPAYLRLALTALFLSGKAVPVRSSSIFAKSSPHGTRVATPSQDSRSGPLMDSAFSPGPTRLNINFGPDHRLTFRLTEPVPLRG